MLKGRQVRWIWYASRSERPVPLDTKCYPSIEFDGKPLPRPQWICQGENGGLHIDAKFGPIDAHVASHPVSGMELNWTDPYGLNLISSSWIDVIGDLIDPNRAFLGVVVLDGETIDTWRTIHGLKQPALKSDHMSIRVCERCGNVSTWTRGKEFFDAPDIDDQVLLVNGSGIYVREDIARERRIAAPLGSFEPSLVKWRPQVGATSAGTA